MSKVADLLDALSCSVQSCHEQGEASAAEVNTDG
jgi:hypothetical protein